MSLMHAPRKRRVRHLHPPVDPGAVDDLLRFRERFGTDSHHRDEILDGELVVSPLLSRWHERVCQRLFKHKRDREIKPRLCGRAGVPLYLLIDRFTDPLSLTILSKPGADGYAKTDTVAFGEKLRLPSPFQFTLDTSGIPVPR